jgi:aerobic-type carbon monoxide dehydrogenase small subunit (CoxS/CutS family)
MSETTVQLSVNGTPREVVVPAEELLLDTLRERLGLTGAKRSCDVQVCGTCTVLVDSEPVSSCTFLTCDADGSEVLTIEGFSETPEFEEFRQSFIEQAALQCGFCTSGILLTLKSLRDAGELTSREDIIAGLDGNICRCTGYKSIVQAAEALIVVPGGSSRGTGTPVSNGDS